MLNERQKQMLRDLERTQIPITANALSKKYEVSLRTVRNDMQCIADEISDLDCSFQRTPHIGMQIISKHQIMEQTVKEQFDYLSLDSKERECLLVLCFLLKDNPITVDYLSTLFLVSKGTIMNDIRFVQTHSNCYDLTLTGIRNKGYFLEGNNKNLIRFINMCSTELNLSLLHYYFIEQQQFYSYTDREQLNETMEYIDQRLLWKIVNKDRFYVWLALYIKVYQRKNREEIETKMLDESPKIQQLIIYLEYHFHVLLDQIAVTALKYLLNLHTDFTEDINDIRISEDLSVAVDEMLKEMVAMEPAIVEELDHLHDDITRHLLCSANRKSLNLENDNPLLHKIKIRYLDLWNKVEVAKRAFEKVYPMPLDDNEVGFITLYFARSLEKHEKLQEAKVLVVCNTGRGVSRLLITRILNNLPEIHIVALQSYLSLQENEELLKQIDLIITTIPLPEINKPYVVVSPFLTELELARVKEAAWLSCQQYLPIYKADLNEIVDSVVTKYATNPKKDEMSNVINDPFGSNVSLHTTYLDSEIYAQISVEVISFVKVVVESLSRTFSYEILSGIMAHVIMSIPRWKRGDFIKVMDFDEMKALYPREFKLILSFINRAERILDVFIDQNEIIAILRYLLI